MEAATYKQACRIAAATVTALVADVNESAALVRLSVDAAAHDIAAATSESEEAKFERKILIDGQGDLMATRWGGSEADACPITGDVAGI